MTVQAIGTKVVVKRLSQEQKSPGGLILSNTEDPNPLSEVISIGSDIKSPQFEIGDKLYIAWSHTVKIGDYFIVDFTNIFARA
jgi:co-chaperonin GroES (HSP10)